MPLKQQTGKIDHKPQKYSTLGSNHTILNRDNVNMECDTMCQHGNTALHGTWGGVREVRQAQALSRDIQIHHFTYFVRSTSYSPADHACSRCGRTGEAELRQWPNDQWLTFSHLRSYAASHLTIVPRTGLLAVVVLLN